MQHVRCHVGLVGGFTLLTLFAACSARVGGESSDDSDQVAVVSRALSTTTVRAVSFSDLQADFPAEVESQIDTASLRASAIVGWYDKGQNFHKEKMEKNLQSDFGDIVTNPAVLRGEVIQEAEVIQETTQF
jgi:hypothetical protein